LSGKNIDVFLLMLTSIYTPDWRNPAPPDGYQGRGYQMRLMKDMLAAIQTPIENGGPVAHCGGLLLRLNQILVPTSGIERTMARECRDGVLANI
jgi:hypothetical protein